MPGFLAPGCRPRQLPCKRAAGGEPLPLNTWKRSEGPVEQEEAEKAIYRPSGLPFPLRLPVWQRTARCGVFREAAQALPPGSRH